MSNSQSFAPGSGGHSTRRRAFLNDRILLVAGAERGIGTAICRAACEVGAATVLAGNDEARLKSEAKQLKVDGFQALFAPVDVTNEQEVQEVFAGVHDRFGRIDLVVVNTGATRLRPFSDLSLDDWYVQLQVNLTGAFLCMREALRLMSYRRDGQIVVLNAAPPATPLPPEAAVWTATRSALAQIIAGVREEAREAGVRLTHLQIGAREMLRWDSGAAAAAATTMTGTDRTELARQVVMACRPRSRVFHEEILLATPEAGMYDSQPSS